MRSQVRSQAEWGAGARGGSKCQLHTAGPEFEAYIAEEGSQIWRGSLTVVYKDDSDFNSAVQSCRELAKAPDFAASKLSVGPDQRGLPVAITCPFGNSFLLRVASLEERDGLGPESGSRDGSENSVALGIAGASLPCKRGTARRIADFYLRYLGMPSEEIEGGVRVRGTCQFLDFEETDGDLPPYTGDHICIYIADFKTCFERLSEAGLVWINPRFTHLDATSNGNWDEACQYKQFRFKAITAPDGEVLLEQEHEVRMVDHGSCPLAAHVRDPHRCLKP